MPRIKPPSHLSKPPYQSNLVPYEKEIAALRRLNPPKTYTEIAEYLYNKYKLKINRSTICKFVKVRSKEKFYTRKVYQILENTENGMPVSEITFEPSRNYTPEDLKNASKVERMRRQIERELGGKTLEYVVDRFIRLKTECQEIRNKLGEATKPYLEKIIELNEKIRIDGHKHTDEIRELKNQIHSLKVKYGEI